MKRLPYALTVAAVSFVLFFSSPGFAQESATRAQWAPFQIAFIKPIQLVSADHNIAGLRLDLIYGKNADVWGFDIGLWNDSIGMNGIEAGFANETSFLRGLQFGVANAALGEAYGMQAGVINGLGRDAGILQVGVVNDTTSPLGGFNQVYGIQLGLFNMSLLPFAPWGPADIDPLGTTAFHGLQIGLVNAANEMNGVSIGAINTANSAGGLEIGIVNFCGTLRGVQLGMFNIISEGQVPFLPVINADW